MIHLMVQIFFALLAAALVLELASGAAAIWKRLRGRLDPAHPAEAIVSQQPGGV